MTLSEAIDILNKNNYILENFNPKKILKLFPKVKAILKNNLDPVFDIKLKNYSYFEISAVNENFEYIVFIRFPYYDYLKDHVLEVKAELRRSNSYKLEDGNLLFKPINNDMDFETVLKPIFEIVNKAGQCIKDNVRPPEIIDVPVDKDLQKMKNDHIKMLYKTGQMDIKDDDMW